MGPSGASGMQTETTWQELPPTMICLSQTRPCMEKAQDGHGPRQKEERGLTTYCFRRGKDHLSHQGEVRITEISFRRLGMECQRITCRCGWMSGGFTSTGTQGGEENRKPNRLPCLTKSCWRKKSLHMRERKEKQKGVKGMRPSQGLQISGDMCKQESMRLKKAISQPGRRRSTSSSLVRRFSNIPPLGFNLNNPISNRKRGLR